MQTTLIVPSERVNETAFVMVTNSPEESEDVEEEEDDEESSGVSRNPTPTEAAPATASSGCRDADGQTDVFGFQPHFNSTHFQFGQVHFGENQM